jgi:hypothetical protein
MKKCYLERQDVGEMKEKAKGDTVITSTRLSKEELLRILKVKGESLLSSTLL